MFRALLLTALAPAALIGASPPSQPQSQARPITAAERQQGTAADGGIVEEFGGRYSGRQLAYTTGVAERVAVQSGLGASPNSFTVTMLNSPVNNALAIPGGYVYVTRQLMALMNDEAELAAVLGHEVAHVAARHSRKRQNVAQRNAILGAIGQVLVGAVAGDSSLGRVLTEGVGTGSQLATLGFSRSQETQSDDLAIQYLVRAGYDPAALSSMLRSLAAQQALDSRISGNARSVPQWASTHPDPASRVQRAATRAAATRRTGLRNRDSFLAAIDGMIYGEDPAQGVIEGSSFLHPQMRIAFTAPQGFAIQNGASAVSISGPNAQARFTTAAYRGDLDAYVREALQALGTGGSTSRVAVQRSSVNGIPAAYAQVRASSGSTQVDATIFAYAPSRDRAYHFILIAPAGQGIGAMGPLVQSFRTLSASEAAAIRPRYVRVVTVRAGDTQTSLAQRMAYADHRLERFQVLNGLDSRSPLAPGRKVKIVTY